MKTLLYAPSEYWQLTPEDRSLLTNGCGTKGLPGKLVPDTVYFLSIKEACNIHDYMYQAGATIEDKQAADRAFLNNMLRLIEDGSSSRILKTLRSYRAMSYYEAVRDFGGPAFWNDKNKPAEMGRVK